MYIIMRRAGEYVARSPITGSSYTGDVLKAQQYATREAAEHDKCGNETIVDVHDLLYRSR